MIVKSDMNSLLILPRAMKRLHCNYEMERFPSPLRRKGFGLELDGRVGAQGSGLRDYTVFGPPLHTPRLLQEYGQVSLARKIDEKCHCIESLR